MENEELINKNQDAIKKPLIKSNGKRSFVYEENDYDKKIGHGGFGEVVEQSVMSNGREIKFAKKISKKNKEGAFTTEEIERQLEVYDRLKSGGLKTFTTFRTDGKAFYSTLLNKKGIIALSGNNMPPSKTDSDISYKESLAHKVEINNLSEVLEEIKKQAILASKVGITLSSDSLFFLVPESGSEAPVDIDFIIGDFDIVTASDARKNRSAYRSLAKLKICTEKFLDKYAKSEKEANYYLEAASVLNPNLLDDDKVLVESGIKNINDYSVTDGEVLKSNSLIINATSNWHDIEKILKIPGTDLGFDEQKHKNRLLSMEGSLRTSGLKYYDNLIEVGGDLFVSFADEIISDTLITVGGSIDTLGGARNFITPKLKTVGDDLNAEDIRIFIAPNLQNIKNIVLTKKLFINANGKIDWEDLKQEKRLVIPEKLRTKIVWT